jgi:hypothetical protein
MQPFETDYLVIGAGTAGMAFADSLIQEDSSAHVTLVDRHAKPGGHWNDAYPFVTLHQPSAFYGVNSLELGSGHKDSGGLNRGLYELASGPEISGYFNRVMNQRLLPSGRVRYQPMCNYLGESGGDHRFESLLSGEVTPVTVRRKLVDANFYGPRVPSTHKPRFSVAPGVRLVPPNALVHLWQSAIDGPSPRPRRFVILGAGKTAMDAAIWLLQAGTPAAAIRWVMPRDAWLINRITTQPGAEFFEQSIGGQADQMEAFAQATSVDDLFLRLEACGVLLRIHADRTPTMFHLATMTPAEVELLRSIGDVVRLGRVQALQADRMQLEQGVLAVEPDTLFVDCTASAVEPRASQPIFQDRRIVLQIARLPQPAFSAALTAYIEAHYSGDSEKNRLCAPVPFPNTLAQYLQSMMVSMWNQFQWGQDKALRGWIRASRLDGFGRLMTGIDAADAPRQAILARLKTQTPAALANLQRLSAKA